MMLFLLLLKLLFLSPIILLFSVLLASHDQLCHAKNHAINLIDQCAGDSRKLFRVVNSLSREPLETAPPENDDPTKLADEFGTFFLKKLNS